MNTSLLSGSLFSKMVAGGSANLFANRTVVNDLNVFPIPDGDTGDNMYMTIHAGADIKAEESTVGSVASSVAHGMLLGARGNSGVILSRIFAGIASGLGGQAEADIKTVHHAFSTGVSEAYHAVSTPVEGTILTVCRDSVRYAGQNLSDSSSLESYFDDIVNESKKSLDRTPDLLAVLKEAGVVDSGGAGYVYIMEGMRDVLCGKEIKQTEDDNPQNHASPICIDSFTENSVLAFGYCTEYLLRLQNCKCNPDSFDLDAYTSHLCGIGESVVTFRDGTIVKTHVHTMHPGEVLDFAQQYGEFLTLKIENMMLQHNEATIENRYSEKEEKTPLTNRHKAYATVTVAAGEGLKNTFYSLGVDAVIEGGQSMNPSASDFIHAFENINADTILVYPNNGNIILTAGQAASLYKKAEIVIIPTKTIGQGYAAISMLDTASSDTAVIAAEAEEAMASTVTGTIARANRDTEKDDICIHAGDFIGFSDDVIYTDCTERTQALYDLASSLHAEQYGIMLLFCGADTPESEMAKAAEKLEKLYPRTEIISINGGQPIYDYIMILE